jgi:hypothetical protein
LFGPNLQIYMKISHLPLMGLMIVTLCGGLRGSGAYVVRPVRPPERLIEGSQKYELGKSIFLGKAALTDQNGVDRAAQQNRLAALQEKLPARVKKTVNLTDFSGKLTSEVRLKVE